MGPAGPVGIDMTPFLEIAKARGWDLEIVTELLAEIEWRQVQEMTRGR